MSIEAMKQALEALEQERENYRLYGDEDGAPEYIHEAITSLRTAIASYSHALSSAEAIDAAAQLPEAEPSRSDIKQEHGESVMRVRIQRSKAGWLIGHIWWIDDSLMEGLHDLYITPQQRTWVGLTGEEIETQAKKDNHSFYFALGALWAEDKLKAKNFAKEKNTCQYPNCNYPCMNLPDCKDGIKWSDYESDGRIIKENYPEKNKT